MSAGWIKLRDLRNHPKVKALAVRLKVRRGDVVGALCGLWHDADQHAVGDVLPLITAEVIDADAEIPGFAQALVDVGWLDLTPEGARLPRYEEQNGETAKRRAENSKRQSASRSRNASVTDSCDIGATKARPEKRRVEEKREEKNCEASASVRPETPEASSGPPAAADDPVLLTFPTDGKPSSWQLRESKVAEFEAAYPSLNVRQEVRNSLQWILAAPERRKTAGGMQRFLVGWLNRAQNSNRPRGHPNGSQGGRTAAVDEFMRIYGDEK